MYLTQPVFWEALHDDFSGKPEQFEPQAADSPYVAYVSVHDDDGAFLGLAIVSKHSEVQVEVHNALLPSIGWKKRVQVGRAFLEWVWAAGRKRVIGKVVGSNRYALKYNELVGMELIGINVKSFMKKGILENEHWFGVSAPEVKP